MQKAKFSFEEALFIDPNHGATIEAISMFMGSAEEKEFSNDLIMYSSKKLLMVQQNILPISEKQWLEIIT